MTKEELKEWKQHPLTKQVFKDLRGIQEKCAANALQHALSDPALIPGKLGYELGVYETVQSILEMEVIDEE